MSDTELERYISKDDFGLPVMKVVQLTIKQGGCTVHLDLTKAEATELLGKLSAQLDAADVLKAIGGAR